MQTDDERINELLEKILETSSTPEEVCANEPDLLPILRARLNRLRNLNHQIGELFPKSNSGDVDGAPSGATGPGADPQHISAYELQEVLGRGGMGVVYRAIHQKLKRTVALKMLLSGVYATPNELARFLREAESAAGLQHPHIVQVYDVGEFQSRPYFTMEYIEAGSLAQSLQGTPLAIIRSASLLATLADAVEYAHQHGIVHRDLKPANILLKSDGTAKIADFGLARRVDGWDELTLSGVRVGSPSYMAPEQAMGQTKSLGPPVDIHALGAILYELLTGRPPFRGESVTETLRQVVEMEPARPSQLNPKVPRDLEIICLKCLNKEQRNRYQSAADLREDLIRFLDGKPILARRLGWWGRIRCWCRQKPMTAALIITAIMSTSIILSGGIWMVQQKSAQRTLIDRQQERTSIALDTALNQALDLQAQGRWPEAHTILRGALTLIDANDVPGFRQRVVRGIADTEMAQRLEEIRLQLSDGRKTPDAAALSPEGLYSNAFHNYGIDLATQTAAQTAQQIKDSKIRIVLLAFLYDWFHWVSSKNLERLVEVLELTDDDPWRREFRHAFASKNDELLAKLAQSPLAQDQPPVLLSGLGGALLGMGNHEIAMAMLSRAQQSHPNDFWINYLVGQFWSSENPATAIGYFRAAIAIRPSSDQAYMKLGQSLVAINDTTGAIAAYRKCISLNPSYLVARDLAKLLAARDELEEACVAWELFLKPNPPDHESWYGYAQLCLYLDHEQKYRENRSAILDRFESTESMIIAERTSLACLVLPDTETGLRRSVQLADRAVTAGRDQPDNPYLQFLEGLCKYRQGDHARAIPLLEQAAIGLANRAGPRLTLAMAQYKSGQRDTALKSLAHAVRSYNWNREQATHTTVWVSHILRREAEKLILPQLPAFLNGTYQPMNNDERLSLLGICQHERRYLATARLYADAFSEDPTLADAMTNECIRRATAGQETAVDQIEALNTACRYLAARSAVAAASQADSTQALTVSEKAFWRQKGREWLRADLVLWTDQTRVEHAVTPRLVKVILTNWQTEPDLAGIRDAIHLAHLPADERDDCLALWKQISTQINR